jgi:hypothetical protein
MKVTNNASFPVKAFGVHTKHGYGTDTYIKPGESAEISGPYLGEMGGGSCRIAIPGEIICHEGPDGEGTFQIAQKSPIHLQTGEVGVKVRQRFDDPEPYVTAWWNREAVLMASEDGTPPCENPENLVCHHCKEEKHVSEFIPNTTACMGCHEMTVMRETGHGVVTHEGPGLLGLDGNVYKVN